MTASNLLQFNEIAKTKGSIFEYYKKLNNASLFLFKILILLLKNYIFEDNHPYSLPRSVGYH